LRGLGDRLRPVIPGRHERDRLAIAQRDGSRLVEEQHIHVAGRLHGAPRYREHVGPDQPIHAGNADGGEESPDRGRDQAHQERHQYRDGNRPP